MSATPEARAKLATGMIEAVNNRLDGVVRMLEMLRKLEDAQEPDVLLILEDTVVDQIQTLQESVLPLIDHDPEPASPT